MPKPLPGEDLERQAEWDTGAKFAWVLGAMLAGTVLTSLLLALLFFAWIYLLPDQANALELGVLIILLVIPTLGVMMGAPLGCILALRRPGLARRAAGPLCLLALIPGASSVWLFSQNGWAGSWVQISYGLAQASFYLLPVLVAIGLLGSGLALMWLRA